jgi:hypothetical protein
VVITGNRLFAADDARIRKIARAAPEPVAAVEFKAFLALLLRTYPDIRPYYSR